MKQLAAALIFFTRLPLWRVVRSGRLLPAGGGLLVRDRVADRCRDGGVLYGAAFLLPVPAAVLAAVIARVLLTGRCTKTGFPIFWTVSGGGRTREQTLAIMKDSRTGSYGIIGADSLFRAARRAARFVPVPVACAAVLCGDPFCKFVASMTINFLPTRVRRLRANPAWCSTDARRRNSLRRGVRCAADAVAVLSALLACRACAVRVHCVAYSTDATPYRRVHRGLLRCGIPVVRGLVLCGFGRFIPILWKRYWCIPLTFRRAFATDGRMCR